MGALLERVVIVLLCDFDSRTGFAEKLVRVLNRFWVQKSVHCRLLT